MRQTLAVQVSNSIVCIDGVSAFLHFTITAWRPGMLCGDWCYTPPTPPPAAAVHVVLLVNQTAIHAIPASIAQVRRQA
jgi:hypothetical protein